MAANYQIKSGETLTLTLRRVDGDLSIVADVVARLKKAGPNASIPPKTAPVVATLETFIIVDGWQFILADNFTELLEPGIYVADAKLNLVDGGTLKTDPVTVEIRPSVS